MKIDINNTEIETVHMEESLNPMYNKTAKKPKYIIGADELLNNEIEDIPYLWKPFFPKVGLVGLVGGSDTGKSSFLREFAMALTSKEEKYIGYKLEPEHNSVLYVSTEDDSYAISSLIKKQKIKGKESSDYKNLNFIFDTTDLKSNIEEELSRMPYDCFIIDAFADIYNRDLNRVNEVRSFLQGFSNIANKYKLLVIVLHHTGKGKEYSKPSKNSILGSQGFEAKMRMVADLRVDPNDPDLRHFSIIKGNYMNGEYKKESHVLEFINLKFTNTGKRVPIDEIFQSEDRPDRSEEKAFVKELRGKGKSLRDIEKEMGEKNMPISKSTVHNWVNDMENYS
ncbi:AAA family ATPase [Bacteroidota bacterium]